MFWLKLSIISSYTSIVPKMTFPLCTTSSGAIIYSYVCMKTEEPKEKRENIESNIYDILTAFLWKNWPVIDERTYRLRYMHYSLNHPGLLLVYKRYGMLLPKRATMLVSETRYGHIHWPYIGTLIRFYHIHSCLFGIFHTHQYMKAGTKKREMEQF